MRIDPRRRRAAAWALGLGVLLASGGCASVNRPAQPAAGATPAERPTSLVAGDGLGMRVLTPQNTPVQGSWRGETETGTVVAAVR